MTFLGFDSNIALLAVFAVALVVVIVGSLFMGGWFLSERLRLPDAVRFYNLEGEIGAREGYASELERQNRERAAKLSERDHAEAEESYWRSLVESTKAEYESLGEQRQEIEKFREEYRNAVEDLGAKEGELREARSELEDVQGRREQAEAAAESAETKRAEAESAAEAVERRRQELEDEEGSWRGRIEGLIQEADEARHAVAEARAEADAKRTELDRLLQQEAGFKEQLATLEHQIAAAREEIGRLEGDRKVADEVREELRDLKAQRQDLRNDLDEKDSRRSHLEAKLAQLEQVIEERSQEVPAGATQAGGGPNAMPSIEHVLGDLRRPPSCLAYRGDEEGRADRWEDQLEVEKEQNALDRVMRSLRQSGLEFPRRTVYAFHTSLKTAVISPMTVLAGISGTGKSQLPRRYADAMGIHFLKIPVQPRWDSPQDLFGFFNYIEQRYKATDLARALVHLDPYNWKEESEPFKDRMLMVLLDEMNLARVEYYFAEFLSRLEGRPLNASEAPDGERRPAEIEIDVSHEDKRPYKVYPGQNVLFCGTMNEDESTLTLSDKVLDRANVMRFPRPHNLREDLPTPTDAHAATGYLPKDRWLKSWMRRQSDLPKPSHDLAKHVIQDINDAMDGMERPFGHRMSQSMLHYAANYPGSGDRQSVETALADQVEQRILPKLSGVPVDGSSRDLQALVGIVREELHDDELATAIHEAIQRSEALGIFNWRGFARDAR
ncbi:McrB family protein [Ferruginivarius sediminum]|uniref:ATPase dynein-related AAA domain-containing protein n=1 Tax=Ferruginivarius sediminum TaxID=2661937 RepID=A0A369T8W2_9PROT|nr:hypothetical protein [Ferruginivarius sediminum]RDD60607.1 hypothetical protein DRB17_17190 [Ferruginivarius sediminum]